MLRDTQEAMKLNAPSRRELHRVQVRFVYCAYASRREMARRAAFGHGLVVPPTAAFESRAASAQSVAEIATFAHTTHFWDRGL